MSIENIKKLIVTDWISFELSSPLDDWSRLQTIKESIKVICEDITCEDMGSTKEDALLNYELEFTLIKLLKKLCFEKVFPSCPYYISEADLRFGWLYSSLVMLPVPGSSDDVDIAAIIFKLDNNGTTIIAAPKRYKAMWYHYLIANGVNHEDALPM